MLVDGLLGYPPPFGHRESVSASDFLDSTFRAGLHEPFRFSPTFEAICYTDCFDRLTSLAKSLISKDREI
jgi:hypothetical protein